MDFIDWGAVDLVMVGIYAVMAFLAALIANLLNAIFGDNRFFGALLAGVLFAAIYVGWTYYPHGIDLGQKTPVAVKKQ